MNIIRHMYGRARRALFSGRPGQHAHGRVLVPLAMGATVMLVAGGLMTFGGDRNAQAANAWDFDPGYIISDANFFDSNSLDANQVQAFLNQRVPTCQNWKSGGPDDPVTCMKDYWTNVNGRDANANCARMDGGWLSAAQIIDRVARACGISQKVLLVMLQKEQGLVTHTWPSSGGEYDRYRFAMGYACPDSGPGGSAACDATTGGFGNQMYLAAWQLKQYIANQNSYKYKAGATNSIQWNVPEWCGRSDVYIRNAPTAALYIYTPYRPNNAALAAGYGQGDDCSSYGNRNFFLYYSDWFGDPKGYPVHGAIGARYDAGGAASWLGLPTSAEFTGLKSGGASQTFQAGTIFWSPSTDAHAVQGALLERYARERWEQGWLGYPSTDEFSGLRDGGATETFQGGTLHWSQASGSHATRGAIRDRYAAVHWERSELGYPTAEELTALVEGGASQKFQGGVIFWSPAAGAHEVRAGFLDAYRTLGWEAGSLGYPVDGEITGLRDGGSAQVFQYGQLHWSPTSGTHQTHGAIQAYWSDQHWQDGWLGYPTSDEYAINAITTAQDFQGGTIRWSAASGIATE